MKMSYHLLRATLPVRIKLCLILLISLTTLSFMQSCKKSNENAEIVLEKNLTKSPDKYAKLIAERNGGTGSFTIQDIKRNGDILTIKVKGGCKPEDFHAYWDGLTLLSYPAQINLVLQNTGVTDCGSETEFDVTVNLTKIIGKHDSKDYVFNVANGSVKQDKSLNPDGSVSNK